MSLGRLVAQGLGSLAPDWAIYYGDGDGSSPGRIRVKKSSWPEGKAIEIPASGVDSDHGSQIGVRFHRRKRQLPYTVSKTPSARGKLSGSVLSFLQLWSQPEAAPRISGRSSLVQPQLKLSLSGAPDRIVELDRTADPWGFTFNQTRTDLLGLLLFKLGAHKILACMHAVWATPDSMTGASLQVVEYALAGTANTPVTVTIDVRRWTATNSIWPSRNHGHFFTHLTGGDVIYTCCVEAGIVCFARSVSGVQVTSNWETDARRFAGRAGNIGCVEQYLIECGYTAPKISFGTWSAGGHQIQLYTRNPELAYEPQTPVDLTSLVAGLNWTGVVRQRTIFPVGILQPDGAYSGDTGWAHNLLSNRWPMLVSGARREWWIYINAITSDTAMNPKWVTAMIDAIAGAGEAIDTFQPDWAWHALYEDLVSTRSAELEAAADASREGSGTPISGASETLTYYFEVEPGDPEADPPVEPRVESITTGIIGTLVGTYYTGEQLQAAGPFVVLDSGGTIANDVTGCRFYAAPLPAISLPVGDVYTSSQAPAGTFDEAGLHFGVCFEPQNWATDLVAYDNVSTGGYSSDARYYKWGDQLRSEATGTTYYLWWITKAYNILGEIYDVDPPHLYETIDGVTDPGGYGSEGPAGNALIGTFDPIFTRKYATKQHGRYEQAYRYRTWVTVCNPDKTLKFRTDISKYYRDGGSDGFPSRNPSPQLLNVWEWLPVGSWLWVLRHDYVDSITGPLDSGDNCFELSQEPFIELWSVGASELTLLHRMWLHPTTDTALEYSDGSLGHQPHMKVGITLDGKPYCIVWTEWTSGSVPQAHLITEVILESGGLTRTEKWGTGEKPSGDQCISVEARNAVHDGGNLYWISGGSAVFKKSST